MKQDKVQPQAQEKQGRKQYEAPAVIYSGVISARAGSPLDNPLNSNGYDPADLFGQ